MKSSKSLTKILRKHTHRIQERNVKTVKYGRDVEVRFINGDDQHRVLRRAQQKLNCKGRWKDTLAGD
ncbi:hypothetical protein Tco_0792466 [Tanacetum coccineum]